MNNEECLKVLQAMWRYKDCGYSEYEIRESLDMAIEALENKQVLINKVKQAKRKINQAYNKYNKYCTASLLYYACDVDDIIDNLIGEIEDNE